MNQSHKVNPILVVLAAWMIAVLLLSGLLIGGSFHLVELWLNSLPAEEPRFRQ